MKNKIINGLLILVSIAFFFYGLTQQIAAQREAKYVEQLKVEFLNCKESAEMARKEAEALRATANHVAMEAERQWQAADEALEKIRKKK